MLGGMELYLHSHSPRPWEAQGKLTIPSWVDQCLCGKARMLSKHSTGKTSQEFGSDLVRIRKCGMSDPRGALGESHRLGTFVALCGRPQAGPLL